MITIKRERYEELLEAEAWLSALEAAGVDNWEGVDYASELYREENNVGEDE